MNNFISAAKESKIEETEISDKFISSFSIIPGEINNEYDSFFEKKLMNQN